MRVFQSIHNKNIVLYDCKIIDSCPVGALRRRLLHRNGTFVPPAPSTPLRRQVKMGRSGAVFQSIRTIRRGKTIEISVPSQPSIQFFPLPARNGPFRAGSGKNQINGCDGTEISVVLPLGLMENRPPYGSFSPKMSFHLPTKRC